MATWLVTSTWAGQTALLTRRLRLRTGQPNAVYGWMAVPVHQCRCPTGREPSTSVHQTSSPPSSPGHPSHPALPACPSPAAPIYLGRQCSPLSQHCCLEHQLLTHRVVCQGEVRQQLVHNLRRVVWGAHDEEQVERAAADGHIGIAQAGDDRLLMPVNCRRGEGLATTSGGCREIEMS